MDLVVPKDELENRRFRAIILQKCQEDHKFMAAIRAKFFKDIIFAFNTFFWTYDPRRPPYTLPFITYDFQDESILALKEAIDGPEDLLIEKSRDMGASWFVISVFLYYWLQPHGGNDFIVGSRKEEYVDKVGVLDTLFEKQRWQLKHLPDFLMPSGFLWKQHDSYMRLVNPETGSYIKGEANNSNFGTGGRYKAALLDEFAKWQKTDETAWRSLGDSTPCRIALSTPYGKRNHFSHLRHETKMKTMTLHWRRHPLKDATWYENECARRSDLDVAQELDISYEASGGKRFFKNYNPAIHLGVLTANKHLPVMRCWDFGFHYPCVVFCQVDVGDRLLLLRCIMGKDVELTPFAEYVLEKQGQWFDEEIEFEDYCDPAGIQINDQTGVTSIAALKSVTGQSPRNRKFNRDDRAKSVRALFDRMIGGSPKIMLNEEEDDRQKGMTPSFIESESCYLIHEALLGGCQYPDTEVLKEEYEKDGYYEHPIDSLGHMTSIRFPYNKQQGQMKDQKKQALEISSRNLKKRQVLYLDRYRRTGARRGVVMSQEGKKAIGDDDV